MKKLRIHVVNRYFYPVTAGIETNLMEVYGRLAKKGHEVTIHVSRNTLEEKNVLKRNEYIRGMKVIRYDCKWFGFIPEIPLNSLDIISLHNFNMSPNIFVLIWILALKILGKKKFTLMLSPQSGFNPDWVSMPKNRAIVKSFLHRTLGRMLINLTADGVRAISKWEKDEMIKSGIRKNLIKLIGNGTQEEALFDNESKVNSQFKKIIKDSKPFIIQIGRIHPIKNYETSIRALGKMHEKFKLLIIGSVENEQYFKSLKDLINELGLKKRLMFLSGLSDAEKYYSLANAEAMVHMSRHEGYCLAVHEGMSQGLVCIVSNKTALPYLIKEGVNGYCLEPDDFIAVAEKIKFVLANKNSPIIKNIKRRNIEFTKNHSWKNVARKVESFYLNHLA